MNVVVRFMKWIMVVAAASLAMASHAAEMSRLALPKRPPVLRVTDKMALRRLIRATQIWLARGKKYLNRQLQMFQSGERDVPLMTAQLIGKSDQDLQDLAAYYASLPAKIGEAKGSDSEIKSARMIYKGGIAAKGVAACASCHGPGGLGNDQAGFPRIGGQSVDYTIAQLTAYREGRRASDEAFGAMMRNVAAGLSDGQIADLADYIHGLQP